MKVLRWTLVAPFAVAAWYATFFLVIVVHQAVEESACPAGQLESGSCQNERVQQLLEGVIVAFIALSAVAVVAAAAVTAPAHRVVTAWVMFGAGGLVAAYFAIATSMYVAGIAAELAGLATAAAITRYSRARARERALAITAP
jgi:hypothetical protein